MLADEITQDLRQTRDQAIAKAKGGRRSVEVSLKSKDISYGKIRVNPDGSVDPFQLEGVNEDLRVRPFFHHGGTISIREFVVGALNARNGP